MEDLVFHRQLDRVGELEAVGAEELDAVVAPGIVRGGDDHAGVEAVRARQEGDGRGGHDARALDARSGWRRPAARVAAIQGLDSRVSRPRITLGLRRTCAASGRAPGRRRRWWLGRGGFAATARMPSVPKSLRAVDASSSHFLRDLFLLRDWLSHDSTRLVKAPSLGAW